MLLLYIKFGNNASERVSEALFCTILDNAAYVEQGYRSGYTQGVADGLSKVNIQYTYHEHIGSAGTTANGCYTSASSTPQYGTHKEYLPTGAINAYICQYCSCTMRYMNEANYQWVTKATEKETCTKNIIGYNYIYSLGCGKTTNTIESATIIY